MDTDSQYLQEEEGVDFKKYIQLILRHWWWFAISIFISVTIAYMVNRYSQEVYQTSCTIIVGDTKSETGSIENILDEFTRKGNKTRKAVVENEISILKSYKMARMTIEELDFGISYTKVGRRNIAESRLYTNCPFIALPDTINNVPPSGTVYINIISDNEYIASIGEEFKQKLFFGKKFQHGNLAFTLYLRNPETFQFNPQFSNKYYFTINNINSLTNAYRKSLIVELNSEKGSILTLSKSGYVPEEIADYLNKLCEIYIRANLEEKNLTSSNTIKFIDEQLRGVVDSLEATGLRLQRFRSANKVINLSREGTFLFDKMQELQSEKAAHDIKDRYYNYLLKYIQNRSDFSDVAAPSVVGIDDMLLNKLVGELNRLNLERRNFNLSVVEKSPQANILTNKIANTRSALQENLESLIEGNKIAVNELDGRIKKIETEVQKLPGTERQLINIEREFTINDQIYTFLLEKRAEAGITKASNTSDHLILDIARPENATIIKPKSSSNLLLAVIMGGLLPIALLLLMDFFNTKITDIKYIETQLKVPIIGNIGHSDLISELPVNENPRSSLSESFRALRTSLQYIANDSSGKVIAISSAVSGEGKTFCSINLATIFALADKKVLLVSLDLRRPKIHKIFNYPNEEGLSTFFIGKTNYEQLISKTNISNLSIAVSGPIPPNPAELITSNKMTEFIDKSKKDFDYIILDTPPLGIVSDTLGLTQYINGLIFVIRHNYSNKHVIQLVNSIKEKGQLKNIGVAINDIQLRGYYGYTYRYGYGYGYGYSMYSNYYSDNEVSRRFGFNAIKKLFNTKKNS